jgi:D-xylose transport system permease protein
MLGMIGALVIIWVGLHILSGGLFLTPRNLWNLSVQTSAVAIMACGMVLVIVMRNIDLSIGSAEGVIGMVMGFAQVHFLVRFIGLELGNPWIWVLALVIGLALGLLIGAFQGFIIAYLEVPAFIVTLGGLLVWRGAAWWVTSGQTVAPLDATFQLMGGGPAGSIGATWSWVVGIVACLAAVFALFNGRVQRKRFRFPLRPVWAETLMGTVTCAIILGAVWVANSYPWPVGIVNRYAAAHNITVPDGGLFIHGNRGRRCDDIHHQPDTLRPLRLCHRRQSGSRQSGGHQHALDHHEGVHDHGRAGNDCRGDLIGPAEFGYQCAWHAGRAAGDCRSRHRRHVACRWFGHHHRRHARRAFDAIAAVRHGAARCRLAVAEHRRRRRAGHRGVSRHRLSQASLSMIPKSGNRISEKIMRKQESRENDHG